jgi:hypothetical protein
MFLMKSNTFKDIFKELKSLNPLQLHSGTESNKTSCLNIFNAQRYATKRGGRQYSRGPPGEASN